MPVARPASSSSATRAPATQLHSNSGALHKAYGKGGLFLFGKFRNADALFTPVASRFETYAMPVARDTRAYMDALFAAKAFRQWKADSATEKDIAPEDEVD